MIVGGLALLMAAVILYKNPFMSSEGDVVQIPVESPERLARIKNMAEHWPKQPDFRDRFNPLNPAADISVDTKPGDASAALPKDANGTYELVAAYCGGCHSLNIVTQQHASRQRWEQLLVWMEKKQGMPKLPEKEEAEILDYLSTYFSS